MEWDEETGSTAHPAFYSNGGSDFAHTDVAIETYGVPGQQQQVVNYFFPVEIIIEGSLSGEERGRLEEMIFASLTNALDRMA